MSLYFDFFRKICYNLLIVEDENPKLDSSIKVELENLISKFLDKGLKEQEKSKSNTESQSNTDNKGKALWEETKKVRKAL